jgi:hypothetical protein
MNDQQNDEGNKTPDKPLIARPLARFRFRFQKLKAVTDCLQMRDEEDIVIVAFPSITRGSLNILRFKLPVTLAQAVEAVELHFSRPLTKRDHDDLRSIDLRQTPKPRTTRAELLGEEVLLYNIWITPCGSAILQLCRKDQAETRLWISRMTKLDMWQ